ncbi:hypothetical protein NL676_008305 [Syzygium grande]|nr:hypothetical protein NL676_008305 [Syzygium grande]
MTTTITGMSSHGSYDHLMTVARDCRCGGNTENRTNEVKIAINAAAVPPLSLDHSTLCSYLNFILRFDDGGEDASPRRSSSSSSSSELGAAPPSWPRGTSPLGGSGWCSLDGVVAFRDSCTRLPARSFDCVLLPFSRVPDCSILAAFLLVLDCFGCSLGVKGVLVL